MRGTTSLGITLAPPHEVIRASPILASTGSFSTYPTRNFATLGTLLLDSERVKAWSFAFCHALHIAMQVGPSHPLKVERSGVWPLRIPRSDWILSRGLSC